MFIDYCVKNGAYTNEKVIPEKPHMLDPGKRADSDKKKKKNDKSRSEKTKKPQQNHSQNSERTYVPPHSRRFNSTSQNDSTRFDRRRNTKPPTRKFDSEVQTSENSSSEEDLSDYFNKFSF